MAAIFPTEGTRRTAGHGACLAAQSAVFGTYTPAMLIQSNGHRRIVAHCLGRWPRQFPPSQSAGPRQDCVAPSPAALLDSENIEIVPATLEQKVVALTSLVRELCRLDTYEDKLQLMLAHPCVVEFMTTHEGALIRSQLTGMPVKHAFVLACSVAIGQDHVLSVLPSNGALVPALAAYAEALVHVEDFYDSIGGLAGYQLQCVRLLAAQQQQEQQQQTISNASLPSTSTSGSINELLADDMDVEFLVPRGLNLASVEDCPEVARATLAGIEGLPHLAEIYPLGGAGDRLGLSCEETGDCLPTAVLQYCGRSLLETLIRDLQAREYVHFKLHGVQHTTPVAVMTSAAKGNHWRVADLFDKVHWYGRGRDAFRLFQQPLVPVLDTIDAKWLLPAPLEPMMKPGGHGVIWKLMLDTGVFDWLRESERTAAIVRQISNPMAGQDRTLLALAGEGLLGQRAFGFASCERVVGAAEGMNVLLRERVTETRSHHRMSDSSNGARNGNQTYSYRVTNVEYTDFERFGIEDKPSEIGGSYSLFPANTNVLFIGLQKVEAAVRSGVAARSAEAVLPGMILNTKKETSYVDVCTGTERRVHAARLECTMQNLADSFGTVLMDAEPNCAGGEVSAGQRCVANEDENRYHGNDADNHAYAAEINGITYGHFDSTPAPDPARLDTFLVYGPRRKVTSSAKRQRTPGSTKIHQTPDGSLYDLMQNAADMLRRCGFDVPCVGNVTTYLDQGPGFLFLFHPALGPLWDVVAQKLRGGKLYPRSEVQLEVAEADIEQLTVDGSLLVLADAPLGRLVPSVDKNKSNTESKLIFGDECGRVRLRNVTVRNEGVDWTDPGNVYWRHKVSRRECCKVVLHGSAQFEACDVELRGDLSFEVPDGHVMHVVTGRGGGLLDVSLKKVDNPLWSWEYRLAKSDVGSGCERIQLRVRD
jgi:UTP---glucose-1-phosphate uridylyltransferase